MNYAIRYTDVADGRCDHSDVSAARGRWRNGSETVKIPIQYNSIPSFDANRRSICRSHYELYYAAAAKSRPIFNNDVPTLSNHAFKTFNNLTSEILWFCTLAPTLWYDDLEQRSRSTMLTTQALICKLDIQTILKFPHFEISTFWN